MQATISVDVSLRFHLQGLHSLRDQAHKRSLIFYSNWYLDGRLIWICRSESTSVISDITIRKCHGIRKVRWELLNIDSIGREFQIASICVNNVKFFLYVKTALLAVPFMCDFTNLTPASYRPSNCGVLVSSLFECSSNRTRSSFSSRLAPKICNVLRVIADFSTTGIHKL